MRRLIWEKQRVVLPMVGDTVGALEYFQGAFPTLALFASDGSIAELSFGPEARLWWGTDGEETPLAASADPRDFACALALIGAHVTEAFAYRNGGLWLEFDRRWTIRLDAMSGERENGWPSRLWKLDYPRPGRPVGGSVADGFTVEGYREDLLAFGG